MTTRTASGSTYTLGYDEENRLTSVSRAATLYATGELLPESRVFARRTHFVLMEIYAERIELAAIDQEGEVFDQAVIPLP